MKRLFALMLTLCMLLSVQTHSAAAIETDMSTTPADRSIGYNTLDYSIVHEWDPATMEEYNCYAYVLGRTTWCLVGDFSTETYDDSKGIAELALVVKADLKGSLGYQCVKIQTDCPSSTTGWSNVIAVRKDTTYDVYSPGEGRRVNDYHFAKLTSSGWYHKPGGTAVLKFNEAPSNSRDWTNEQFDGVRYLTPSVSYDSELRFMLYKPEHGATTYTWTGQHYHAKTKHYYLYGYWCDDCCAYASTDWVIRNCSGPPCGVVRS